MSQGTVYEGSNDRYYGDIDLWERLESGVWSPCFWDENSGEEWIRTADDELLYLTPVSQSALPEQVQLEHVTEGIRVRHSSISPENC